MPTPREQAGTACPNELIILAFANLWIESDRELPEVFFTVTFDSDWVWWFLGMSKDCGR